MVQAVPSQRSANGLPITPYPTAMQAVGEMHDTPDRTLWPATVGVGWMAQVVPFHRSTNAIVKLPSLYEYPTATHALVEVQETPRKEDTVWPLGLGMV
jgi:hypothetical protein